MIIIKKLVWSMCLLYTINVIISRVGAILPINLFSITFIAIFDIPAIIGLILLKYLI